MKKTDHSLRSTLRDRVDALLGALPTAVAIMDRDGVVRYGWNPAAESLFGRTRSEAIGRVIPLFDGDCSVDFADLLRRAATGETISGTELRYDRGDGSSVYASVSLAPAANIVGGRRGTRIIVGLFEDITQRKQAEYLLRESEERFRSVFEDGQLGMAIVDLDTRIVQANRRMAKVFGCAPHELAGVMVKDLSHPDDVPDVAARIERLATGSIDYFDAENRYIRKDGSTLVGRVVGTLIGSTGEARSGHIIAMLEDVTARRQTQEELSNTMAKLRQSMRQAILAMAHIVEVRDPYTAGHQERVACLARAISQTLGLPEDEVSGIYYASLVHDIGKISIPGEILSKPGRLSSAEFELIRVHPQAGYDIVRSIDFPWPVNDIVLQHHERLDGSGYPQGLMGDQISYGAVIVAVADVVEAMSSHRPYRPALGVEAALDEIRKNRGRLYDPGVVDACESIVLAQGIDALVSSIP
ncbi:MAG: PAS domain S-box protein [Bacillota bacterium]|jgi:PAS domain S-box-containing protein